MDILQVVGYSNSGKTTTTSALIQYLSQAGISVAALKHHGHGGFPDGLDQKDSIRHQKAGAIISGVEGAGLFQLAKKQPWDFEQIIRIYELFQVDLLIIEGYKKKDYSKIMLIHGEADVELLSETSNIIAVVSDLPLDDSDLEIPVFKRDEMLELCEWVLHKFN